MSLTPLSKQEKRIKPYLRYCDDFVIFSNDKSELHALAAEIKDFLGSKLLFAAEQM